MLLFRQILVSTFVLGMGAVTLTACGQQGPLYLPTEPAAAHRATLPETLLPFGKKNTTPAAQATPSSVPPIVPTDSTAPQ